MPLVDTNLVSELVRPYPNAGVQRWASSLWAVAVSVVTVEEILFGLSWRPNARMSQWLQDFIDMRADLLPVTDDIARVSGQLRGRLMSRGMVRSPADMLIAATAQVHQLALVTRNVRDFEECGIALLNPFS